MRISGALIQNDLIYGHVCFNGRGPHSLPTEPEAIDLTLCVNGVPLDAKANRFITGVSMRIATDIGPHSTYVVPEAGERPEMKFPVGRTEPREQVVGDAANTSVRRKAWTIGRLFRSRLRSGDAERFYDPATTADAIKRAFDDLRRVGSLEHRPHLLIADPYALDERALYAIGTVARLGGVSSIDIVTGFKSGDGDTSGSRGLLGTIWGAFKAWISSRSKEALAKKRQEKRRKAFETADRVAKQLGVRFRFYGAERLHDRFLVVGERIWHAGPSFNKIGKQISAIVEMTDERIKCQVRETGPVYWGYVAKGGGSVSKARENILRQQPFSGKRPGDPWGCLHSGNVFPATRTESAIRSGTRLHRNNSFLSKTSSKASSPSIHSTGSPHLAASNAASGRCGLHEWCDQSASGTPTQPARSTHKLTSTEPNCSRSWGIRYALK